MKARRSDVLVRYLGRRLSGRSLNGKLSVLFLLAGTGVAALSLLLLSVVEWAFSRKAIHDDYAVIAGIIADNVNAAVQFGNEKSARDVLAVLSLKKGLVYAEVLLPDGETFAEHGTRPEARMSWELGAESVVRVSYLNSRIEAVAPLIRPREGVVGYVYISGDLDDVYATLVLKAAAVIVAMLLAGLFVLRMASRLGAVITQPILELADTARRISQGHDFSQRQAKAYDDETGQLVESFNSMMDLIQSRDAIIRSNEERFREYFELGVVGMAILDDASRFLEANGELARLLGTTVEELKASVFDEWMAPAVGGVEATTFDLLKKRCEPGYSGEHWLRNKQGERVYMIVAVRRIRPPSEGSYRYIVLLQDITGRKRSEEELLASKRAAEAANRSKDEFLSVMSHELRTPLNPILGFVDLLLRMDDDPERVGMLQAVRKSSEHLLRLITDILEFSRSQAGRLELVEEVVDLSEICSSVVELMRPGAAEREVALALRSVDTTLASGEVELLSDQGKIRQLMLNLISNAIKYNRPGGHVWVDGKVVVGPDGGYSLRISVEDTGIGIPEEMQGYVFEPFTQLDMSLQRRHEGVGLGLAICSRIVERMDGRISLRSSVGIGSIFTFELPVAHRRKAGAPQLAAGSFGEGQVSGLAGRKVLLVEDDLYNKLLVEAILKRIGVEFAWAENGLAALERMREEPFDLVLMDIRMPLMDGLEATRRIRQSETEEDRTPIVAMTAHTSERMRGECLRAGMDGYITKPVEYADLQGYIRRYLAS